MAKKRTMNEIEKDYKKIRKVVETTKVHSIKEIAKLVGLSEAEVRTSLSKHPRVMAKMLATLEQNRKDIKPHKKAEQEALKVQRKDEQEVIETQQKAEQKTLVIPKKADYELGYVIDASITGTEEFRDTIAKIRSSSAKIILTSVTIKELETMQKFKDIKAVEARHVLGLAAEYFEDFHNVLIDESLATPDDCIINYCSSNKERVVLLTSDKTMALKARMYGVKTKYMKQPTKKSVATGFTPYVPNVTTSVIGNKRLKLAQFLNGKLLIKKFKSPNKNILVLSEGIEYKKGIYELKIGDDVFVASDKEEYLTLAHYKVTNIAPYNNCIMVYSSRFYSTKEIFDLPRADYKSFMKDFIRR